MAYQLTPEDFAEVEAMEKQKSIEDSLLGNLKSKADMYVKAGDIAERFINKPMRSLTGGALQGAEHGLASIANLPLKGVNAIAGTDLKVPYIDIQDKLPQEPINRALFMGGQIAGQSLPGVGVYGQLSKIGNAGLGLNALKGALTGFATGGSEDNDMLTRLASSLFGAVVPPVSGLRNKNIAGKVVERKGQLENEFANAYEKVLEGTEKVAVPSKYKLNIRELSDVMGTPEFKELASGKNRKFMESYFDYLRNSNIKSAHKAQSELRKLSSKIESEINLAKRQDREVPDVTRKAFQLAKSLRDKVKGNIGETAEEKGMQDFLHSYEELGKGYASKMTPYFNPAIAKYEQGITRPTDLVKALARDERFAKPGGAYKDIPGLATKRFYYESPAQEYMQKLIAGGALGAGALAAYSAGLPAIGRFLSNQ